MRSARHEDRRWAARAACVASNARGHALRVSVLAPVFAAALVMLPGQVAQAAPTTKLVWLQDDAPIGVERIGQQDQAAPATLRTPLGSVWKLFVYSYLHAHGATETPYRCAAGQRKTDEEYCCDPGERIERDAALARSCGPYFEPARVGIDAQAWADYWRTQWQAQAEAQGAADAARNAAAASTAPAWLLDLNAVQPDTEVAVADLLHALRAIATPERMAARTALLPVAIRHDAVLGALGTGTRFKTWSWQIGGERAGGAAGWRADGTPFWFGAAGTSRTALQTHAGWIAAQWAAREAAPPLPEAAAVEAQPCIEVEYFARYPIRSVLRADGSAAPPGPLNGRVRVFFANDNALPVDATPALVLNSDRDGWRIHARLALEDYVARVVDREGDAHETAAARALAVAARTYVLQNAGEAEGCRLIADDSRTQRVSPNPPSAAARAVAAYTEGLVLDGAPVRYHVSRAAPGVMSWEGAVQASRDGQGFEAILREAYPANGFAPAQAAADCTPMPEAGDWLMQRQQRWRAVLRAQPGYEPLDEAPLVCRLSMGIPHSDQRRLEIRVRDWASREGRVTLIHEYLHLVFRAHPNGQDESFIEQLAQRLADS
mgnify:CR=1 FL=1